MLRANPAMEYGTQAIAGVESALEVLRGGQVITLDAAEGVVYEDRLRGVQRPDQCTVLDVRRRAI